MKVELCYWEEGYNNKSYDIKKEDLEEYIDWCEENNYVVDDERSLIEFLELEGINSESDFNLRNSSLEVINGTRMVLDKCLEIANEYKRNKDKVS